MGRRLWARVIDIALGLLLLYIVARFVPAPRLLARMALGMGAMTAYEALFCLQLRATPGKLATGLRVAELDSARIDQVTAWTRGLVTTITSLAVILSVPALTVLADGGPGFLLGGTIISIAGGSLLAVLTFPARRGVADRIAGTIVVPFEAPDVVTRQAVDVEDQVTRPRPLTPWGPVASVEARRRARAARLDDTPVLVVALVAVTVAWTLSAPLLVTAGLALGFALLLVRDEALRIGRDGGTSGHRREGLVVLDEETGEPPGPAATWARAVTLTVFWLVPPLLVALALWVQLSPTGRGPHDLVAGTVVVEDQGGRS